MADLDATANVAVIGGEAEGAFRNSQPIWFFEPVPIGALWRAVATRTLDARSRVNWAAGASQDQLGETLAEVELFELMSRFLQRAHVPRAMPVTVLPNHRFTPTQIQLATAVIDEALRDVAASAAEAQCSRDETTETSYRDAAAIARKLKEFVAGLPLV